MFKLGAATIIIVGICTSSIAGDRSCDNGLNIARRNVLLSNRFRESFAQNSFIFEVPVSNLGLEYYYRVKDSESLTLKDDDIEKLSDAIVAKLINKLALPTGPNQPTQPSDPTVESTPIPKPEPEPLDEVGKLNLKALTILKTNCAKCHSGDKINGGLEIIKDDDIANLNREQKFDIFISAFDQKMPKGGDPLSDEDVIVLKEWAKLKK